MALVIALHEDILSVVETTHSATRTTTQFWYYHIKDWTVSSFGRMGDTPDRPCSPSSIEWCKKYYLPKVGIPYKEEA